jgi:hypothetical protein
MKREIFLFLNPEDLRPSACPVESTKWELGPLNLLNLYRDNLSNRKMLSLESYIAGATPYLTRP